MNAYKDFQKVQAEHMPQSIQIVAKLGSWGAYHGNINRYLKTLLGKPTVPNANMIFIPMKVPKPASDATEAVKGKFPVLLPHELFAHLYNDNEPMFGELFVGTTFTNGDVSGGATILDGFWSTVSDRQNQDY